MKEKIYWCWICEFGIIIFKNVVFEVNRDLLDKVKLMLLIASSLINNWDLISRDCSSQKRSFTKTKP